MLLAEYLDVSGNQILELASVLPAVRADLSHTCMPCDIAHLFLFYFRGRLNPRFDSGHGRKPLTHKGHELTVRHPQSNES